MKKIGLALSLFFLLLPIYANENIGFTPSLKLSMLGFEPAIAMNYNNLETEISVPFKTTADSSSIYAAPAINISYNTKPFSKGYSSTVGFEYMYLMAGYTESLFSLIENDSTDYPSLHAFSVFYRAGINFSDHFGIQIKARQPLCILSAKSNSNYRMSILNDIGFLESYLILVSTISVGVKYTF